MATCPNGHENLDDDRHFCGDCGARIVPATWVCPNGHLNLWESAFLRAMRDTDDRSGSMAGR